MEIILKRYFEETSMATLVLLQGQPATGKTALGKQIAKHFAMPFFSRDTYKEAMYDAFGKNNRDTIEWSQKLGAVSFEVLYRIIEDMLNAGVSCVAETAWIPAYAEPKIMDILKKTGASCVQVYVHTNSATREERFQQRAQTSRHEAHMDIQRIEKNGFAKEDKHTMLDIPGKTITIDTTNFELIDMEFVLKQIKSQTSSSQER